MRAVAASTSGFALLYVCVSTLSAVEQAPASAAEGAQLFADAYIYAYPLVTMEMTRRVITNAATPIDMHAPMGQFYNAKEYPDASFKDVTAPNADTLYSTAFLDLALEPYLLSLPDEAGRYYLMPMLSGWTDVFAVPGKRTTGTGPQTYAITGPKWSGSLPAGVKEIKAPTDMVWILGRTYCTGTPEDYAAVHALQAKYDLRPLSVYGKEYTPPVGKVNPQTNMKTAVREQVNGLPAAEFFKLFAELLKSNPPAEADAPMVAKLAKIGIVPGQDFDASRLSGEMAAAVEAGHKLALDQIVEHLSHAGKELNGWIYPVPGGQYGTDYLQRAAIAFYGLGCNRTDDAVYPTSEADTEGKPYDGANKYTITFAKGQMPPVNGFWSLTMYNGDYFFVANPLNRYTLSERNKLTPNADGSTTLYIQHENPGPEKEANWLPAPGGKFVLMLRLYWPKETPPSILDGSWSPPAVVRMP